MIGLRELQNDAANFGIELDDKMLLQFKLYAEKLLEWNGKVNLTAITQPREICVKHFLDSLIILKDVRITKGAAVIDVGTGAGFPGIPMKIVRPDIKLTLLDSLNKRIVFLREISELLCQDNLCIHARAEEAARLRDYREQYDVAVARAVAALPVLYEYCIPFVMVDGRFVAMKGYQVEQEIESARGALGQLGAELEAVMKYDLPIDIRRSIIVHHKISHTPQKYPRLQAKIAKTPL